MLRFFCMILLFFLSANYIIPCYNSLKLNNINNQNYKKSLFLLRESSFFDNINKIFRSNTVDINSDPEMSIEITCKKPSRTIIQYFEYWNCRDMENAVSLFSEECVYEDTLYPNQFIGKESLKSHLLNVAASLPNSFQFKIDEISESDETGNVGIQWHVESDGNQLPFTRGCSMYTVKNGLIVKGFDIPEPVVKAGSINLFILNIAKKIIFEPQRVFAIVSWIFYCWFLFLSDIPPGPNALALDVNTWNEVKDLSLNFWLVLPIITPNLAANLNPVLEGVFNLVLAWSALFFGFIIDGKGNNKNKDENSMLTTLVTMQFLTNAMFLPYLITRDNYEDKKINENDNNSLTIIEKIGESKILPILLLFIGSLSIGWGFFGRMDDYNNLNERIDSFLLLLNNDRLSFSFLVDLTYYSVFQGWLINDDNKRRDGNNNSINIIIGKFIPFFGLVYYLLTRPSLPNNKRL